jgi:murein DD-endopeptidase MepM/ murein hydrolase activator NlpD
MRERWRVVARACSILLPGTLALLGCATGKPSPSSTSTPAIGIHHFVRPGETLAAIGRMYGVGWQSLAMVNQLADPHLIEVGQVIWIPSPANDAPKSMSPLAAPSRFVPDRLLQWPVQGVLSSGFGMRSGRLHAGIDIPGERGTPVLAAEDGVVLFSGRGPNGYGNTVILHHYHGLTTLYAHNERNMVQQGAQVRRGQIVALVGDTGRASGTHLHFEVHLDGRLTDPRRWLP